MDIERIEKVAKQYVCPNSKTPETLYEINMVKWLVNFGVLLLTEFKNIQPHDVEEYYKE